VKNELVSLYSHAYADSLTSILKAQAFAYVVWEIMGDAINASSRTTGAIQSAGTSLTLTGTADPLEGQIDAYLAALSSNSWTAVNGANLSTATTYAYTVYYDPATTASPHQAQNFLVVTPGSGGATGGTVPVPGSLALAGLGLIGLAGVQRRKTKT
jgi:hypothetical protein